MVFPRARVSRDELPWNSSDSRSSRSPMVSRTRFGISIPTVDFPEMRSMRTDSAWSARQRSSASEVILLYLMPGVGLELERGDDRTGMDLQHLPLDRELPRARLEHLRPLHEVFFVGLYFLAPGLEDPERRHVPPALLRIEGEDLLLRLGQPTSGAFFGGRRPSRRLRRFCRAPRVPACFLLLSLSPSPSARASSPRARGASPCVSSPGSGGRRSRSRRPSSSATTRTTRNPLESDQWVTTTIAVKRSVTSRMNAPIGLSASTR